MSSRARLPPDDVALNMPVNALSSTALVLVGSHNLERPHSITANVDQALLDDLKVRLGQSRWPDKEPCSDWSQGIPLAYVQELAEYWQHEYDWRRAEALLNQHPQYLVPLELDGQSHHIHCLHIRSSNPNAKALVLTHGWPGSVFEFYKLIEGLTEPQDHGDSTADAFHVVIPSLPGYGFSSKPTATGTSVEHIADLWVLLMQALGYDQFFAQGGDWGSLVTCAIAQRHPNICAGIHVNMLLVKPDPATLDSLTPAEQHALVALEHYAKWDAGYTKQQSTRPQTLGYALADSPIGQLAWIVEKFWAWTDCKQDDDGHPERALTRDEMLDTVSLYWLTNSAASSARLYWESAHGPNFLAINTPTGASCFPRDIFLASERWAQKRFSDLRFWNEHDIGGHFAALEQPELLLADIRECFRRMR